MTTTSPATDRGQRVIVAGRSPDDRRLPPLRDRMCPPMPADRLVGWLVPIGIAIVGGLMRVIGLGHPRKFVFDETYYPKDAFSLLKFGVEHEFVKPANEMILRGDFDVFKGPAFIVHPPAGKWMMALGIDAFGMNPFGWRIAVALMGTLSILVMCRVVRRLTRSTLLGCLAGTLLALDGLHLVESRIALVDLPTMFWVLLALGALLVDRDWSRARLAVGADEVATDGWGPRLLYRPWRLAAGVCLGLACATKWNAVLVLAAFGLLTWAWDIGARRAIGVHLLAPGAPPRLLLDTAVAFATVVGTAIATYVATWFGWFASSNAYGRNWAADHPASGLAALVPDALRSLWHYHAETWHFHTNLIDKHPYMSNAWGWLVLNRPVSFDWVDKIGPDQGCPTEKCVREILGLGTPILWWGSTIALIVCVVLWLAARDWRFGIPVVGVAATWVPWLFNSERPIFSFYAIVILPFLVIGMTLVLGRILGPRDSTPERRMWGASVVGAFVLLVLLNFAYIWPILTDQMIPYDDWLARMWLGSWV